MRKGKILLWALLGVLILIGLVTLGSNVAYQFDRSTVCVATDQQSIPSPHDSNVVSIITATCGKTRNEVRVRLTSAGKVYQLFSGSSETPNPSVAIVWASAKHVELRYSRSIHVEFPPQIDEVKHLFGGVEVTYASM